MVSSNDQTILFSELKGNVDLCPKRRFGGISGICDMIQCYDYRERRKTGGGI